MPLTVKGTNKRQLDMYEEYVKYNKKDENIGTAI